MYIYYYLYIITTVTLKKADTFIRCRAGDLTQRELFK